ncbi:helix-turn-helix transcriptional regulator [Agrobacterium tumefaciens]|nr:AlpA family phage regulatory protein [Agrobacterium tumefaciens]
MDDETKDSKPAVGRLMSPKEAATETTLSAMQLSTMAQRGEFPKPIWISKGRSAYVRDEVMAWIDTRISERDKGEKP